jgi:tight adherence protein C
MGMNELRDAISSRLSGSPEWLIQWGPSILVFLVVSVAFFLIARIWVRKPSREQIRLQRISPEELAMADSEAGGVFAAMAPALAVQIPETEKERRDFHKLLRQAGLYHPRARITIYALRFVLMVVPVILAGICVVVADDPRLTWQIVIGGLMAGAVLSIFPRLYVWFRRRHRLQRIRQGLPDTIDMLSMCSSGGLGLSESLDHVTGQLAAYPELAQELMILRRQAEVGSLKHALADFSERVDLPEARQLAALLTRGTQLGTQLAGSLNQQADHLRIARRQMATMAANKTPVKLVFPLLFCMAPAALLLLLAPAMFDLHDFMYPKPETAATAAPGEAFGTGAMISTLQSLNQRVDVPVIGGGAPTVQPPGR